jgi:hypothetical protein
MHLEEKLGKANEFLTEFAEKMQERKIDACRLMLTGVLKLCSLSSEESIATLITLGSMLVKENAENPREVFLAISRQMLEFSKEHKDEK